MTWTRSNFKEIPIPNSNPEQRGERCGRRAGVKFRAAAAEGRPFNRVDAFRPTNVPAFKLEAAEMIGSPSEQVQQSGKFWLSYIAAFEKEFPEHEKYS